MKLQQNLENTLEDWARITSLGYTLLTPALSVALQAGPVRELDSDRLGAFAEGDALCMGAGDIDVHKIFHDGVLRYLLVVSGTHKEKKALTELVLTQVRSLLDAYAPKEDKFVFLRDVLVGDCPEKEIEGRARQLRISTEARRVIFYVQMKTPQDEAALTMIRNLFTSRSKDYILPFGENAILILREILSTDTPQELDRVAHMLIDMLAAEAMTGSWVAYSNIAPNLFALHKAFLEASMAMEVGKLFYGEKSVFSYRSLGIGRLIYSLPQDVCELFVDEIFGGRDLSDLDEDTLSTIRLHFENNLNLSETSRQLYIHRNTLVYRFEKVEKRFGLDLKTFEDAVTFKIGLMVLDYLREKHPPLS